MGVILRPSNLSCVRLFVLGGASEISQIHNNIGKRFEFMTVIGSTVQWREEDANEATAARILSWRSRGICAMIFDTGWIPWVLRYNLRFDLNLRFLEEIHLATMWRAACKSFSISSQLTRSAILQNRARQSEAYLREGNPPQISIPVDLQLPDFHTTVKPAPIFLI